MSQVQRLESQVARLKAELATLRADIEARDEALAAVLTTRGWHCSRREAFPWETPTQFDQRHGKTRNWLARQRFNGRPVPEFEGDYGKLNGCKKARLIRLRSNIELEAYAQNRNHT